MATVGLLHPGEMGAAVGGCLVSVGHEVLWDPAGRSRATTGRALAAELTGVKFGRLIARSSVIFSICPPHAALDVAHQVAAAGYTGCYVDANAISVGHRAAGRAIVTAAGAAYVDGGIIGLPPEVAGHTRLYLSGPQANEVRVLFNRLRPRRADRRRPALRGVGGQDGLRRLDQGQLRPAARGPRAGQGGGRRADAACRVVAVPARPSKTSPSARPRRRPPRAGAGSPRWRRSPLPWRRPACRRGFHEAAADIYDRASRAETPATRRPAATEPPSTLDSIMSALM